MSVLSNISLPSDLKNLDDKQLNQLAEEIRQKILETTSKNGGHLSSNLGIVETTIALYHVFDFPKDKLIFDVGHQCYAHKILSGRMERFDSLRKDGGISGFPSISESEYDAFGAGHAGTSISAGLGFCSARDALNEDYTVINLVGDASIVNGLNLEAISMSTKKPKNYLVVLNDNGMSISKNQNGFYRYLSKKTTRRGYQGGKRAIKKIFGQSFITRGLAKFRNFIKRVIGGGNYFENQGFKYVGVVDGNDIKELVKQLKQVKVLLKDRSVFLHINTTKGKGFEKAEERADVYHGVGENLKADCGSFAKTLGDKINSLIDNDKKIMAITAGMKAGTGLFLVEEKYKENFVDVGIAEDFAVVNACGMALGGLKPIVAIYSTFLQRAYDQILHDVCMQNLPVVFCLDRAGVVGSDGKTHQGVFDLSYLTHLPNMTVLAPSCCKELEMALDYALSLKSPVAIRYPKNQVGDRPILSFSDGLWETVKEGKDAVILAVGPKMLEIAQKCAEKDQSLGVINARSVKPLCSKTLDEISNKIIVTLEENSVLGGFGSLVNGYYNSKGVKARVHNLGIKDCFVEHGSIDEQLKNNGLTVEGVERIISAYRENE
ncbi:MAG: 1-deoxy-D-xylulose-5-phosphate synthase [Clostridia bacterium]|nr:1-deoxy-D-xylulose-5-phosphate synthase [Clostridia bacterium]